MVQFFMPHSVEKVAMTTPCNVALVVLGFNYEANNASAYQISTKLDNASLTIQHIFPVRLLGGKIVDPISQRWVPN